MASAHSDNGISKGRRRILGCATVVAGLVVGLVIGEIALRLTGFSAPDFYRADQVLGHSLIPEMSGWYSNEGESFVEINRDGFRDVEHTLEKPSGSYRIAVVGDSYVEGFQVEQDEIFANFLTKGAAGCDMAGALTVEVMSFGVSGYGTAQEYLLIREQVLRYAPDLVVLLVTTNNDISDNSSALKRAPIPYFELRYGELHHDNSFRDSRRYAVNASAPRRLWSWIFNRVRVFQAVDKGRRAISSPNNRPIPSAPTSPSTNGANLERVPAPVELGIDNQIYLPPKDEIWTNAWQVTERLLAEIRDDVEGSGAVFVVVTGSNGIQVARSADVRLSFERRIGVEDLFYPEQRLTSFAKANGIRLEVLAPELRTYAETHNVELHGFGENIGNGHWNQAGHRAAGEILGRRLCSAGMPAE
jgi:hypothetical protein